MAKQFNSSAQNLVYHLEVGVGPAILKASLYILFMGLMALLYVATQYHGFNSPKAMDQAQLARSFSESGRLHTRVIRPGDIYYLEQHGKLTQQADMPLMVGQPDLVNAPVYPVLLGTVFKVFGTQFPQATGTRYVPEQWVIIPLNLLFCFFSGLFVYLLGRQLFSPRVAFTSVTIFLLTGQLWAGAISGTEISFALLCYSFAIWCLVSILNASVNDDAKGLRLFLPALLGAGALLLLFLTRYGSMVLLPGYIMALFLGLKKKAWIPVGMVILVVLIGMSPWILRNISVSGSPFGLAPHYAVQGESQDYFMRSYGDVNNENATVIRGLIVRVLGATQKAFSFTDMHLGSGIALCLFVVTYFYSFQRTPVKILRWLILVSYLCLILAAGIFGHNQFEVAHVMFPLIILYGTAFFYLLLDRMQITVQIVSLGIISFFVFLQALPLLVTLMPPKPSSYPPYLAREISLITSPFEPTELVSSDMPWATAWYGGQLSLYLPLTVDQFFEMNDRLQPVKGLYLTMLTRDLPYQSNLVRGNYISWKPIMDLNPLPRGWPLRVGFPISGGNSVILSDQNRWQNK